MKRFLLKVFCFFVCVAVVDIAFGYGFSWLRSHAKGGQTANNEYIANHACEDIIILGSSRATHSYVSQMIEDSLGMTCYNCGEEGDGVVLAYGRLKMLTDRYRPKLIIYEVTPSSDYSMGKPNKAYLGELRPYYYKEEIRELFDVFDDSLVRLKMISKMYQNTGYLIINIVDNIWYHDNRKGYAPLFGKMDVAKYASTFKWIKDGKIDSLKLSYLEKVIELARIKEIPILFAMSPMYGGQCDIDDFKPAIDICEKNNVQIFSYINCHEVSTNEAFFQDVIHMNHDGAVAYTNIFIKEVLNDENLCILLKK